MDLILPTSMIKESKIILSQIDVRHQGKTLELQCSTRYFKAHYTLKHLFASDVNYYKTLFERQKIELQKQKELNLSIHDVLIGAEGEYDNFTAGCPEFDTARIFKADYDGTTDKGNTAATAVITAHPEIKKWLVTGANEEGCIGAVRALESAGLDADACVVGLGAYMAKDEWNDKGAEGTCMKASAYFSADSVGAGSVEVLYDIINGNEPAMETAVDAVVVTPDTYKDVMGKAAE